MRCSKCNKEIEESGYYCPYCGKKIDRDLIKDSYLSKRKYYKIFVLAIILIFFLCVLPINSIGNSIRADVQVKMGNKYLENLDYDQALASYNEAIKIDPMNIPAYKGAVSVMLEMEDERNAIQLLQQCVKVTENYEMEVWLSQLLEEHEYLAIAIEESNEHVEEKGDEAQQVIEEEINDKKIMEGNLEIIKDNNPGIENERIKWLFSLKINKDVNTYYISDYYIEMNEIEGMKKSENDLIFKIINERNYINYKMYQDVYRFIDINGNMVTNIMASDFSEYGIGDNGWILDNNKFIDLEEKIRLEIPLGYQVQGVFHNGLCRLKEYKTNEWCFMDENGEVLPERYYYATDFQDGIAYVGVKNYDVSEGDSYYIQENEDGTEIKFKVDYTYIKSDGSLLIELPYQVIGKYKEGLISIKDLESEKFGYIDNTGEIVIPCIYKYALDAENGILRVYDENYGDMLLNTEGKTFYDVELYRMDSDLSEKAYMGLVKIIDMNADYEADKGVVNLNGNIIVPCQYAQITILNDGIIKCSKKKYNSDFSVVSETTDYYNTLGLKIEKPDSEAADWKMTGNEFADVSSKLIVSGNGHFLTDREGNILVGNNDFMIYLLSDDIFYYTDGDYLHVYQYIG